MNCWRTTAVADFRSARKCFSISGSLCLMLVLLLATQAHCRPSDEEVSAGGDEYSDVDNVEWHDVKMVDGVMHEDHPVIMYKEDFVSEDYDPTKNRTTSSTNATESGTSGAPRPQRKYKDIAHRRRRLNRTDTEQYRALKPEKMYFDVLPQAPLVVADDSAADNSKFDSSKIRVDVISLIDNENNEKVNDEADEPSKQLLNKRPKKFHSRVRRDAQRDDAHVERRKRNPYLRHHQTDVNSLNFIENTIKSFYRQTQPQTHVRHTVPGNRWNDPYQTAYVYVEKVPRPAAGNGGEVIPDSVGTRFNDATQSPIPSGPVWGSRPQATRSPVQRTTPSLFHDVDPNNNDFSFMNAQPTSRPTTNNRRPTPPPLFHVVGSPENADFSFATPEQQAERQLPQALSAFADSSRLASEDRPLWKDVRPQSGGRTAPDIYKPPRIEQFGPQCALATDSCCDNQIDVVRYNCFQMVGCERTLAEIIDFCDN